MMKINQLIHLIIVLKNNYIDSIRVEKETTEAFKKQEEILNKEAQYLQGTIDIKEKTLAELVRKEKEYDIMKAFYYQKLSEMEAEVKKLEAV